MAVKRLSLAIFDNEMKIRKRKKMKTGKRGCVCVWEKSGTSSDNGFLLWREREWEWHSERVTSEKDVPHGWIGMENGEWRMKKGDY